MEVIVWNCFSDRRETHLFPAHLSKNIKLTHDVLQGAGNIKV